MMTLNRKEIAIAGLGVVNLVSAYILAKQGFRLTLIDKGPSPLSGADWQEKGCTFGGENVRMYSYTEADNYNEKGSQTYAKMDEAFERVIDKNGWLVKDKSRLNELEHSWIKDFHSVDPASANQFGEDIYSLNIQSGSLWDVWMKKAPELFEGLDLRKGILRLYSDPADFAAAQALHGRLGSLTEVIDADEVSARYPVFDDARRNQQLGGVMTVKGFTLKVHDLCLKIIKYLTETEATFRWNTHFSGIRRDALGEVTGIEVDGEVEQYDHYLLSLGAYSGTTLQNTETGNQLHGVLGVWLKLPNLYPELNHSMKIHKTGHVGEDTNIT
ncbi:MAG: FAD-dependent oxidoreductase, partial [Bacteroidota bacterium]